MIYLTDCGEIEVLNFEFDLKPETQVTISGAVYSGDLDENAENYIIMTESEYLDLIVHME